MNRYLRSALLTSLFVVCVVHSQGATWEEKVRNESIRVLTRIASTNQLQDAVGCCGVFVTLTNGAWIAIRVVVKYEPHREVTVARDSEGVWYETKRKFSGRLTPFRRHRELPPSGEPKITTFETESLKFVEAAANLAEARILLHEDPLGFIRLQRPPQITARQSPKIPQKGR